MNDDKVQNDLNAQASGAETLIEPAPEPMEMDMETFTTAPGETPIMTGVPRSNIEQAAAERAARKALEEAERKKNNPTIIIGAIVAFIIIVVSTILVVIALNGGKNNTANTGKKGEISHAEESEPEEPEIITKRVGSTDLGYASIPQAWECDSSFNCSDAEKKNGVEFRASSLGGSTAESNANASRANEAPNSGGTISAVTTETHGDYEMHKYFYYTAASKIWTFRYFFDDGNGYQRIITIYTTDSAASYILTIPDSWTPSQNGTKTEKKAE